MQATTSTENDAEGTSAPPWFIYLIECLDGSIYTGIALDVAARYALHASGKGARYTRSHPPARLLCTLEFPDRSTASKAEYRIKQLKAAEKQRYVETLLASRIGPAAAAPDSCA